MKKKFRHVFTVVREFEARSERAAKSDFGIFHDEAGEMLYGGCGPETLRVELQVSDDSCRGWHTIEETKEESR